MATRRPNAAYLKKPPSAVHEGFAEFIAKTTGVTVEAKVVGLVQRLYPLYLKSPAVQKAKEAERAEREAEARRKAEEKAARLRERLAKIEADRIKVLRELGIEDEPTEDDDESEPEEEEPAPVKRARARKAKAEPEPEAEVIEAADRFTAEDDDESADEVDLTEDSDEDLFEDDDNDEEDW